MRAKPLWWDDACTTLGALLDRDDDALSSYEVDAWPLGVKRARAGLATERPAGVARPTSTADVSRILRWAAEHSVAVVPYGAGSSVTGAAMPCEGALVLDLRGLDRVLAVDSAAGRVHVEAGVLGGELERVLAESGLTTWFSPQSLHRSTVGGWVATGASGQFSSRFGGIEDIVAFLTVVLADGSVVRLGTPPRGAVGPDLKALFIGSEGAFGVVTEVVLRTYPLTPLAGKLACAFPSVDAGLAALRDAMQEGLRPVMLRLYDQDEARHLAVPQPPPAAVLLAAFTGIPEVAAAEERAFRRIAADAGARDLGPAPVEAWLAGRYDFSRVEALLDSVGGYAETIEVAGGWREMPEIYRAMKAALQPVVDEVLAHFSHTYSDGTSLYVIVLGRAEDDTEAVRILEAVWSSAMEAALASGAVISHHHGIGRARSSFLARQLGDGAFVLAAMKNALDPSSILHPGSLVPTGPVETTA